MQVPHCFPQRKRLSRVKQKTVASTSEPHPEVEFLKSEKQRGVKVGVAERCKMIRWRPTAGECIDLQPLGRSQFVD